MDRRRDCACSPQCDNDRMISFKWARFSHVRFTIALAISAGISALPGAVLAAQVQVSVADNNYSPQTMNVNAGDTVVWTDTGNSRHSVISDTGLFNYTLQPGQSYSYTFSTPGSFRYYDSTYGGVGGVGMSATIVVGGTISGSSGTYQQQGQATYGTGSSDSLQQQVQRLLQQVSQLRQQYGATVSGGTSGNSGFGGAQGGAGNLYPSAATSASCPKIGRVLKKGMSGDDVTALQQFLAQDPSIYPDGTVSGYFGSLTEAAVQRWQAKNNIVSSGTPSSTGYGVVGPRTAAAIALLCTQNGSGSSGASGQVGGYIQVSPVTGNAPLTVNVQANVNTTNSCQAASYQLDWGDNSNYVQIPVSANTCTVVSQPYTHLYQMPGTYQIVLSSGSHRTTAQISVYGSSNQQYYQNQAQYQTQGQYSTQYQNSGTYQTATNETFNASVTSGTSPLAVTFSGVLSTSDAGWCQSGCTDTLVFGDGSVTQVPLPTTQGSTLPFSVPHTYQNTGSYTAVLYQGSATQGRPVVGSVTINVQNGTSGTGSANNIYGLLSLTPGVNGDPMTVNVQFPAGGCASYSLDWGDGTQGVTQQNNCGNDAGQGSAQSLTHTYQADGTFTITLRRGPTLSYLDTASMAISNN